MCILYTYIYIHINAHVYIYIHISACAFLTLADRKSPEPPEVGPPKDHINIRILPSLISGIPLILGLGTRM